VQIAIFKFRKRETTKHTGGTPPHKASRKIKESSKNVSEVAEGAQDLASTSIATAFKIPQILIRGAQIFGGIFVGRKLSDYFPPIWKFSRGTIGGAVTNIGTGVLAVMMRKQAPIISALTTDVALGNAAQFAESFIDDILAMAGYKGTTPEGKPTKVFNKLSAVLKTK
jgi:uncharacterized membrane protein